MNRSLETITRVKRPAATRPRSSVTETRKTRRRPSMASRTASALHPGADRGRGQVADLDPVLHGAGALVEPAVEGRPGGLLGEQDDAGRGQHGDVGGAGGGRRVGVADHPLDGRGQTRMELHSRTIEGQCGRGRKEPSPASVSPDKKPRNRALAARRKDPPVVEESVLQRVLAAALRSGGDFAEVYVEDRRNAGARLDDGKIEEFTAGRERGAGIRVVAGAVHRLRPHVGPVGEGADRSGPGRRRRRPGRRGPHHRPGPRSPAGRRRRTRSGSCPSRSRSSARPRSCAGPTTPPGPPAAPSARCRPPTPTPASGC